MAGKKKAVTLFLCLANANTELELQTQFFPPFHGRASVKSDLSDLITNILRPVPDTGEPAAIRSTVAVFRFWF